ncbi:hypothetical protein GCM10020216_043460 [Nonomuraea helvata]
MAASMRARVSGATRLVPLRTKETVAMETLARSATSRIVTMDAASRLVRAREEQGNPIVAASVNRLTSY